MYSARSIFFADAETNERTFGNTHPWRGPRMSKHGVINICAVSSSVNSLAPEKYEVIIGVYNSLAPDRRLSII